MPPPNRALTRATEADMADAMGMCTPTQPTQGVYDPRRTETSHSGPGDVDLSDVLCILHPCSPAAFSIVESTAALAPQHVLQDVSTSNYNDGFTQEELEEKETFILDQGRPPKVLDLALRFSSHRVNPVMGFVFGRHPTYCDIVINTDTVKRVSNIHFRIFVNQSGVCMLEDLSTNGTVVDECILKGKINPNAGTRMLNAGSIIEILSPKLDEVVKFILRIPSRESHMEQFTERFNSYMQEVALAEAEQSRQQGHQEVRKGGVKPAYPRLAATGNLPMVRPAHQHSWGMHWNGGDKYNVVGRLGQGAFATVYRLATKRDGMLFAAKELEKRRFMKNGILDRKLDNELQIMRTTEHDHIVKYVDYQDISNHLYIIMEYVPCGDLQQWIKAHGVLPEPLTNTVAEQVLDALAYLHRKMITHRDIKPDNILIANDSHEAFAVKLSDFGLSKVVKEGETFLKTFCGTLLYCAPEVFPHYDDYLTANGKGPNKRKTRKQATPQRRKYHMYSQSVDIWSLGGVLWYAMCLKPPFEGVADATGKGMFDRIMATPLDATPLRDHSISEAAIDLMKQMLDTDPAERPTPEKCLVHPWFGDRYLTAGSQSVDHGLSTIEEDANEGAAPDLSQLSLHTGRHINNNDDNFGDEEISFDSADFDYLDPRQSKRFKLGPALKTQPARPPTHPLRPTNAAADPGIRALATEAQPKRALFGEVQHSAINSSGVFGVNGTQQMPRSEAPSANSSAYAASAREHEQLFASAASRFPTDYLPDTETDPDEENGNRIAPGFSSLFGADRELDDLKMDSPADSADSPAAETNEPQTPRTPDNAPQSSMGQANGSIDETPKPTEATPREPKYSRQISIPISASFFYNPDDPSTHNPEYASSVTGYDFVSHAAMPAESFQTLPPTLYPSDVSPSSSTASEIAPPPQATTPQFALPAPRLGRLVSTSGSFTEITLNLSSRVTGWGRAPGNTLAYPDIHDVRVPKTGIVLYFHANGIENAENAGTDWTKLPGLHCLLATESSQGIRVNGVKLMAKTKDGRKMYGRVYTDDIITIFSGPSKLEFACTFFHGEGKDKRPDGAPRFNILKEVR